MTAMLPLHALLFFLVVLEPVLGRRAYRRFLRRLPERDSARTRYYAATIATEWLMVAVLAWSARRAGLTAADLGIGPILRDALGFGGGLSGMVGLVFLLAAFVGLLAPIFLVRANAAYRDRAVAALARVRPLLPARPGERRLFIALALTAGICEELLYRSFLFWYVWHLSGPFAHFEVLVLASAIGFGLAHVYQGKRGVIGATGLGFVFALIYAFTGSVLPSMILHAAVDLRVLALLDVLPKEPVPATA